MHGPNAHENADTHAEGANAAQEQVRHNLDDERDRERRRVNQLMQSH